MSQAPKVFLFNNDDPEMQRAYSNARANFRYFWREVAWERRRIVPALDLACVKAPFCDGDQKKRYASDPEVEHMWLSEVDFDGKCVSGVLINSPKWLKSVKQGDAAQLPLGEISDWMYVTRGEVCGAYTVNLLRSRMGKQERQEHDDAWGLNFGNPAKIRLVPEQNKGQGFLKRWFGKKPADASDHPMSLSMASLLREELAKNPAMLSEKNDKGMTLLHQEAMAGSTATMKVLLEAGADATLVCDQGMTPLQLARSLGWENVVAVLTSK